MSSDDQFFLDTIDFTNPLVLTTVPHLFLVQSATQINPLYGGIILLSSLLSIAWHTSGEPEGILMQADYIFAGLWVWAEISVFSNIYGITSRQYKLNIILTKTLVLLNLLVTHVTRTGAVSYEVAHSIWHLLSVAKLLFTIQVLNGVQISFPGKKLTNTDMRESV